MCNSSLISRLVIHYNTSVFIHIKRKKKWHINLHFVLNHSTRAVKSDFTTVSATCAGGLRAEMFWLWENSVRVARVLQIWEKPEKERVSGVFPGFYEKTKPNEMAKSQSFPPPQLICHWLMTVMLMWMPIWSTPRVNLQMKLWKFSSVKTAGKTRLNNCLILEFLKRTGCWRWNYSWYDVDWSGMLEEGGFPQLL